jgi:hypothetical protein
LLVVVGIRVEGVYDKARPNNSHGFTALGLYECSRSRKIAEALRCDIQFSAGVAGASTRVHRSAPLPLRETRSSCQTNSQLSPSPLIRAATRLHQPFSHHVVSLLAAVDLLTLRTTPHTHTSHVYRSLVSTRRRIPRGAKWKARTTITVRKAFTSTWRPPPGGNVHSRALCADIHAFLAPCMP